ncbi:MAG: T9SS type A sorting domain-containing protein [Melioribacteraceae bacterium]|nr:T9SS type A sorting domain-containing protein [Melioribacteraceae bacterium]
MEFSLTQNYPNPFNPSTSIEYSVPSNEFVTLKVYDVLGSTVSTLVNETKEAGKYNVTFDASNLTSGIYFYSINAGGFTQVKKMMLVK